MARKNARLGESRIQPRETSFSHRTIHFNEKHLPMTDSQHELTTTTQKRIDAYLILTTDLKYRHDAENERS